MADLERYQPSGVLFADVPRMDFANVREEARAAQGMTQALDRISEFAFKKASQKAEIEGRRWGYRNAITPEQIEAAEKSGQPLNLPSETTVFGAAARETQATMLRVELEFEARKEFARISSLVDAGKIGVKDVGVAIDAIIEGFSKPIAQVSPEEAAKFRAAVGIAAQPTWKAVNDKALRADAQNIKNDFSLSRRDIEKSIREVWATSTDLVDAQVKIDLIKKNTLVNAARANDDQFLNEARVFLEKVEGEARTQTLANYFSSDEFRGLQSERIGNLEGGKAGKYTQLWGGLLDDEKAAIYDEMKKINDRRENARTAGLNQARADSDVIARKIVMSSDPKEQRKLFDELAAFPVDAMFLQTVKGYIEKPPADGAAEDDIRTLVMISDKARAGSLTVEDLIKASPRLRKTTVSSFAIDIGKKDDDVNYGEQIISLSVGAASVELPPELPTPQAKAFGVATRNRQMLELRKYRNTINPSTGMYPSGLEIRSYADKLAAQASSAMSPIYTEIAKGNEATAKSLIPELAGVDLNDKKATDQALSQYIAKNPKKTSSIQAARNEIENFRKNTEMANRGGAVK